MATWDLHSAIEHDAAPDEEYSQRSRQHCWYEEASNAIGKTVRLSFLRLCILHCIEHAPDGAQTTHCHHLQGNLMHLEPQ